VVVFGGASGAVVALDVKTGAQRWVYDDAGAGLWSTPIFHGDVVWVGFVGGAAALDVATGKERLRIATQGGAHPLVVDDARVVLLDSAAGSAVAFDAKTGAELWRLRGPNIDRERDVSAGFQAERAGADATTLYLPTNVAETWAVDLATGKKKWGYEPGGGVVFGTTLDGDGVFLAAADGVEGTQGASSAIVRVDAATGVVSWRVPVKGLAHAVPIVVGDVVVAPTERGGALVLGRGDGEVRARLTTAASWWGACAAPDGTFFVADEKKKLRAARVAPPPR
jgi:outer membrane protein assembly factor BamB